MEVSDKPEKNDVNSRIYFVTKDADLIESIYAAKHKRSLLNSFLLSFSFLHIIFLRPSIEQPRPLSGPVLQSGVRPLVRILIVTPISIIPSTINNDKMYPAFV